MANNIFDEGKLESLLVANWTQFMDSRIAMSMITNIVSERISQLAIINGSDMRNKGSRLSVSRFVRNGQFLVIWFEISCEIDQGFAEATVEAVINSSGELHPCNVAGILYAT